MASKPGPRVQPFTVWSFEKLATAIAWTRTIYTIDVTVASDAGKVIVNGP